MLTAAATGYRSYPDRLWAVTASVGALTYFNVRFVKRPQVGKRHNLSASRLDVCSPREEYGVQRSIWEEGDEGKVALP